MLTNDKVEYWLSIADDDVKVAKSLLKEKHYLQMGFFCHLIAEKSLKAVVTDVIGETPPKIHTLKKLAVMGEIFDGLSDEQRSLLAELEKYQIEARYPEYKNEIRKALNAEKCKQILKETEEFLCWIKEKLEK